MVCYTDSCTKSANLLRLEGCFDATNCVVNSAVSDQHSVQGIHGGSFFLESSAIYKFGIVPTFITVSRRNAQKIYVASVYFINNIFHSKLQPESYWTQLSSCSYFIRQVALTAISL